MHCVSLCLYLARMPVAVPDSLSPALSPALRQSPPPIEAFYLYVSRGCDSTALYVCTVCLHVCTVHGVHGSCGPCMYSCTVLSFMCVSQACGEARRESRGKARHGTGQHQRQRQHPHTYQGPHTYIPAPAPATAPCTPLCRLHGLQVHGVLIWGRRWERDY